MVRHGATDAQEKVVRHPSLEAMRRVVGCADALRAHVGQDAAGLTVGPVSIGHADAARVAFPIDLSPAAAAKALSRFEDALRELDTAVREAGQATEAAASALELPRERIASRLEALGQLGAALREARLLGPAWHPAVVGATLRALDQSLRPGDPSIFVQVTTTHCL